MLGYQHLPHHPIALSSVPSEECLRLDAGLIWGLSMKIEKIWPGGPPVPEMTVNDCRMTVLQSDLVCHVNRSILPCNYT